MGITKHTTLVLMLIATGLFFRWLEPGQFAFGFDQVQILSNAEKIYSGDITLVGPRTGPAEMFTGPLIYYLTAFLLIIFPNPWALVATSLVIAAATGLALFYLAKRYFSEKIAFIILLLWSFSPFLIKFDRVVWNPNLTILASTLVFFPLVYHLLGKKLHLSDLLLVTLGVFLGFQAHFSGLLLLPMFFALQLFWRKLHLPSLIAGGIGLATTLAPSIIFDLRNNWLNVRGLERFLGNTDEVHSSLHLFRLQDTLGISVSNLGHLLTAHLPNQFSEFIGGLILTAASIFVVRELYQRFRQRVEVTSISRTSMSMLAAIVWSVLFAGALSFYSSTPPEYYFFVQLPAALLLLAVFISYYIGKPSYLHITLIAFVGIVHSLSTFSLFSETSLYTIGNQKRVTADLVQRATEYPISSIAYDMQPVDALGLQYLIEKDLKLQPEGDVIHVISDAPQTKQYNRLGIWIDPRREPSKNYITERDIVIATAPEITLLRDYYRGSIFGSNRVYQVFADGLATHESLVLIEKNDNPFDPASITYKELIAETTPVIGLEGWQWSRYNEIEGFVRHEELYSLLFVPSDQSKEASSRLFDLSVSSILPRPLY